MVEGREERQSSGFGERECEGSRTEGKEIGWGGPEFLRGAGGVRKRAGDGATSGRFCRWREWGFSKMGRAGEEVTLGRKDA